VAIRVLMVDDDSVHLELSERFLTRNNPDYEIVTVETGNETIKLLKEDSFDVVICDIDLASDTMSGLNILEQIRSTGEDVPVIIFTGKSREEYAIQALNLGADYYLRKSSINIESLYAELSYYILTALEKRKTKVALLDSEGKLRVSEERLAEAQRITHLGSWVWDIEEDREIWSDEIYRIFGLAPQEFSATYEAFLESVHPDDREFVKSSVSAAIHNKELYSIDHRIIRPDGNIRYVHEEGEVTYDQEGKPIQMMGTVQDITDRIVTEELVSKSLKASEEMFREIFEESPICIELFDSNGILTGANRQTVEIFGVQGVEDLIGFDLFNDSNTPDLVKEELRKGNSISLETIFDFSKVQLHKQYRSSKTGIMHLQCMYSPLHYGRDEGLQGYIIHIQDVTERYVAEHSLMDSRESYKELYNNALIGLFRVRISDGMILECNDQFAKIFNFENSRILIDSSCFFKDFLPSSATWTQLKGTMKKQERLVIALAVTTKDGQRLWMRFSLRMWPDRGYIEGVMADITQEKQALGMLRKQKEELSDFAHTMSHDLKNIFQNMIGFIELMEDENDFTHLERLQALIFETSQLVDHSVALADAGLTVEEKLVMVDLDKLVRLIAESTIPELIEYIQDPLPVVKADEMKVTQIFRNLFDNAVNHGAPTKIEVKLDVRNTNFCIMIRNNGKEILEPARSKLFLKGFTTSKSGQGYGLTIVKRIVEAHDWTIQLTSSRTTTFELIIPEQNTSE